MNVHFLSGAVVVLVVEHSAYVGRRTMLTRLLLQRDYFQQGGKER